MGDVDIPTNFKTSLPPRKRAKTKEEKEQRRIERILRNRKAAHASREKKRKHVEFLESYVLDLEKQMHLVKALNDKLVSNYTGGNAEIDAMINKVSSLPDLQAKKLQHVTELDSVGCDDDEENENDNENENEDKMGFPKTPESFASSPKDSYHHTSYDDVPELVDSRHSSMSSDSESYSPPQLSSPMTTDKFSLDIITAEPDFYNMSNSVPQTFVKKEIVDDFIPNMVSYDLLSSFDAKVNFDEFQVRLNDEQYVLDELRNPAVIAADKLKMKIVGAHVLCCFDYTRADD